IDNLVNNFGGNPNTTVTVLSGNGTGANTDGAATMDNLIDSLDDIGDEMGPDEQFVLFVTDHGNLDEGVTNFNLDNGFAQITDLDMTAYFDMLEDPNNIPSLTLTSSIDPFSLVNNIGTVALNGNTVFDSGINSFFDVFTEIQFDFDNDGLTDEYRLTATLLEGWFNPLDNVIGFTYEGDSPLPLDLVALNSGAISRKIIPEPTTMTLMTLGALMAARRALKRRPN
ncbi:MAG: PEP-CTERM sorting domain-containing protein, partial [FCB group bacterium]|nr:PEP-CTERM sorting domain-containing protein [FCB group bacterium]